MFDANSTVCTSVHSASLDMYAPREVETFSACKISSTQVFHNVDESTFSSPVTTAATAAAAAGAASALPGALPTPVAGGLYDRRLGSIDGREICATCGCRGDCPGHPGHVQLAIPVFQPALLPSLVKVLKFTCFYCGRLRVSDTVSSLVIKAFELVQLCRFDELQQVTHIALSSFKAAVPKASKGLLEGDTVAFSERQKRALIRLLHVFDEAAKAAVPCTAEDKDSPKDVEKYPASSHDDDAVSQDDYDHVSSVGKRQWPMTATTDADPAESHPESGSQYGVESRCSLDKLMKIRDTEDARLTQTFNEDISKSSWQVSSWRQLRRLVWDRVMSTTVCPNCRKSNSATFHVAHRSVGVEMRWKWTGKPPFDRRSFFFTSLQTCNTRPGTRGGSSGASGADGDLADDTRNLFNERCLTYGRSGQAIGKMQLHAFQLRPLMEHLFNQRLDRLLLQCLIPISARLTSTCFFISTLPVSASNFRPPAAGNAFERGGSRAMPVLHPRTANLLDLLKINERVLLAVNVMKHPDPVGALEDPTRLMELFSGQPVGSIQKSSGAGGAKQPLSAVLTVQEQQRVKEFVMLHAAGNATWLPAYSLQLQRKFNEIVDSTKAENPATAAPGIRQWLEKKEGAIRQKMMGKRVNFAARTVLAPDALIATNEIGVPLEFAMKLTIPEPVTPRNAHLLAAMVINGPFRHPGAVSVKDAAGNVFILEYLSAAARQAKARQILAAIQSGSAKGFSSGSRSGGGGAGGGGAGGGSTETTFTVYRHVLDGDVVLMNRQPSLHRLSLMGHFVRISRGTCTWYCVNDYVLRNRLQHRLLNDRGGGPQESVDTREVKKEKKAKDHTKGKSRDIKEESGDIKEETRDTKGKWRRRHLSGGGRGGSLIHYWKRCHNAGGEECAVDSVPVQKADTTRKDLDATDGFLKEDVFRLNFVNCSSYNADFDGDEMNMHLPQDIMARTEAAYLLNADCHFMVPKDGGPMRGLIQDFCLAGCMLTARDTFFTADVFQTLVYSGLSCYIDAGEGTVILDRGVSSDSRSGASSSFTRGETAVAAAGDPYRRRLLASNLSGKKAEAGRRLVVVPPAVMWPKRLWTGKQVITCVLKTLVDGIATERLAQVNNKRNSRRSEDTSSTATTTYRGMNLTSKAKTPGDAWGGADDGDTEEERVIIQESELLQGVFDKAQFGSNAGGLLHCVFILLGSAAAGLLLQSLAALFCAFLKLRGATASPGDFVLRRSGESERQRLAERIVQAGTYLQEHFTARLNDLMGWTSYEEDNRSSSSLRDRRQQSRTSHDPTGVCSSGVVSSGMTTAAAAAAAAGQHHHHHSEKDVASYGRQEDKDKKEGRECIVNTQSKCEALLQMVSDAASTSVEELKKDMPKASCMLTGISPLEIQLERLRLARLADAVYTLLNIRGDRGDEEKTVTSLRETFTRDHKSLGDTRLVRVKNEEDMEQQLGGGKTRRQKTGTTAHLSPWILTRLQRLPLVAAGHLLTAARMSAQLQKFVFMLKTLVEKEDETGCAWLTRVQEASPSLMEQLLRNFYQVVLHGPSAPMQLHLKPAAQSWRHKRDISLDFSKGQSLPVPSMLVCLPNDGFIQGDPSLLQTRLYHPSWLWRVEGSRAVDVAAARSFERTDRYILQAAARASVASERRGLRTFCIPSELTVRRIGSLYRRHFLGRKEMFNEMLDAFFQSSIGKVASTSTDIINGSSFLYRFPQNGFAGMIKSGSKGSNINFAMISVFLGQQSLEGRRVKNMPSDRSLPSFCAYDFGSQARGFITSSFLSGLREEEYFFHCMAGREGLVDTAVKTAKSGYLQRSVIKGMEALTVRYDGSVRDADDTIIQFVYGDDGRDPVHRSTFEKITSLLENVDLLRCMSSAPSDTFATTKDNASAHRKEEDFATDDDDDDDEVQYIDGPISPFSHVGVTCPTFDRELVHLATNTLKKQRRMWSSVNTVPLRRATSKYDKDKARSSTLFESYRTDEMEGESTTQAELEVLLKLLYQKCLITPGEAVGCVAAQSIGEPATQMTLNTFHLAGHGAANVTMGIPRLRELLQQGAATKTPVIYVPLRSKANLVDGDDRAMINELSESAILAQNAATALRGFTTINLAMCVHSVGVETKVCYQPPHCLEGCPAFHLPPYTKSTANPLAAPFSRLYWEYDVCIQLENLSHFVQVVPSYSQAELCVAVLKKVIRIFLKKVSRLMVASVAHHGRTGFAAARNDVQTFFQQRICQDHRLSRWHHRAKVKEILRTARVATSTAQNGEAAADDGLVGGSAPRVGTERKNVGEREGEDRHDRDREHDNVDDEKENKANEDDDEEEEDDQEKSEEEEEENEERSDDGEERGSEDDEMDGTADRRTNPKRKKETGRRRDAAKPKSSGASLDGDAIAAEDADVESRYTDSASESRHNVESSGESSPAEEEEEEEEEKGLENVGFEEAETSQRTANLRRFNDWTATSNSDKAAKTSFLRLSFAELLRGKEFNMRTHLLEPQFKTDGTDITPTSTDPSLKGDALWESGRRHRGAVLLSEEVASILHGISVCPRTWRIVVKFGWPMEKCPYRLEVLPMLKNLLQKSYIQRPEGVTAPRIVQGEGCVSGQASELQCEGSNIQWIHQMKNESIDHNAIRTNDVRAMLKHYGVEAARICLVKELEKVFSAYGIKVDYRHLALIADFMTHEGGIRPFSRSGITASNAPFLQMSYETSFKFLTEACERAAIDFLTTPSGGLMVGTPAAVGSQQCEIYTRLGSAAECCF